MRISNASSSLPNWVIVSAALAVFPGLQFAANAQLHIVHGDPPSCFVDHSCCIAGSAGCNDSNCCTSVCITDPFCCDIAWDPSCVLAASEACGICATQSCTPDNPHDCDTIGEAGCSDVACCERVCCFDAFCCDVQWDAQCIEHAAFTCVKPNLVACTPEHELENEPCGADWTDGCEVSVFCLGPYQDCCEPHNGQGCSSPACTKSICSYDPFCCDVYWDTLCASEACNDSICKCAIAAIAPWTELECTQEYCGTLWAQSGARDVDYFKFHSYAKGSVFQFTVNSEYPVEASIANTDCGQPVILASAQGTFIELNDRSNPHMSTTRSSNHWPSIACLAAAI